MILDSFSTHRGTGFVPQTPPPTAPHPVQMLPAPHQSHSPFPFLWSHCGEKPPGLNTSSMFWALLARPPGWLWAGGADAHHSPPADTHRQLLQPQPRGLERALAKITARQNQEPAKTKSQLRPNTSWEPGIALATLHCLGTNFPARGPPAPLPGCAMGRVNVGKAGFGPSSAVAQGMGVHCHILPQAAQHSQQRPSTSMDSRSQHGCPVCAEPLGWFWCPAIQRVSAAVPDPAWCHCCSLLGTPQPARIGPPGDGDPVKWLLPELLPNILVPNGLWEHSLCLPWSSWAGTWSHGLGAPHPLAWYWSGLGGCSHLGLTMANWAPCPHQLGLGPPWAGSGHVRRATALGPLGTKGWSWAMQLGMVGHGWT